MSVYPGSLDNFDEDHDDEPTRLVGPDLDDIASAVNSIEAELGLTPSGAAATVADAIGTILTTLTGKQDSATAATDAELAAAIATVNAAIALKQDAATAATDAELAAGLAGKADLVAGVVPTSQIPAIATGQTVTVASQAAMLALTAAQVQPGDVAIRTDLSGRRFLLADADPAILANWIALETPDAVSSVNGQQGAVVLGFADVGAASTTDPRLSDQRTPTDASVTAAKVAAALKPSGTAAAADEALRALGTTGSTAAAGNDARLSDQRTPVDASVTSAKLADDLALPGNPTATTQAQGNNTTRVSTTAFVQTEVGLLVPKSIVDAAGDLLIASANDTVTRLPAPTTTGHVLTADTAEALKMKWAAPAGSSLSRVKLTRAAAQSISNVTPTAIAFTAETYDTAAIWDSGGDTTALTIPSDGVYLLVAHCSFPVSSAGNQRYVTHSLDGTENQVERSIMDASSTVDHRVQHVSTLALTAAQVLRVLAYHDIGSTQNVTAVAALTRLGS